MLACWADHTGLPVACSDESVRPSSDAHGEKPMNTRFTELVGCTAPIQLAGMGPICSDELCAAVSEAGGLGMISVAMTSPEVLGTRLARIQALTRKPIGTNFLIPLT